MKSTFVRLTPCYAVPQVENCFYRSFDKECDAFFTELFAFNKSRCFHGKCRCCIKLEFLLPFDCLENRIKQICKDFMFRFCPELPFCAGKESHGQGTYLTIYISERQYKVDGFQSGHLCKRDFYVNKAGRMCKKNDPDARLIRKKGDLIKSFACNWSNKTHLFMTNGSKFDELMESIKEVYENILDRYGLLQHKQVLIKRVDRHKAHNRYQQRNISKINNLIVHVECSLNKLGQILVDGYLYDEFCSGFHRLRNRYKAIFSNKFFKYHKVKLNIGMNTRWDILDENLDTLHDNFEADLQGFYAQFTTIIE